MEGLKVRTDGSFSNCGLITKEFGFSSSGHDAAGQGSCSVVAQYRARHVEHDVKNREEKNITSAILVPTSPASWRP